MRTVQQNEVRFFDHHYGEGAYNPAGWKLRMNREIRHLQRVTRRKSFGRVLSVGCGDGLFEILLSSRSSHITALDISPEAIRIARNNARKNGISNITFTCQSISELDCSEQFDSVICLSFLHHVPPETLEQFLSDMSKLVARDGFFYSVEPNIKGILRRIGKVVMGKSYHEYHSPDEVEMDPAGLSKSLRAAGFSSIEVSHIHFVLVASLYMFPKAPGFIFYLFYLLDGLCYRSPIARWASEFSVVARK